jgi:tetratricopeptide (TPR) repeat protein
MSHACTDGRFAAPLLALLSPLVLLTGCAGGAAISTGADRGMAVAEVAERDRQAFEIALAEMEAGRWSEARGRLEALAARQPELPGPRVNLAIALRESGEPAVARDLLQEVARSHPEFAPAHHQLGLMLRAEGRFEAADAAYARALAADPDYALAHYNRAVLNDLFLARPAVALAHFQTYRSLAGDPAGQVERWIVELQRRVDADIGLQVADAGAGA